jgi:hypothetical protein
LRRYRACGSFGSLAVVVNFGRGVRLGSAIAYLWWGTSLVALLVAPLVAKLIAPTVNCTNAS